MISIIHLAARVERQTYINDITLLFNGYDVNVFDAINGMTAYSHLDTRRARSHAGCFASHVQVLQEAANSRNYWHVVFEDDAILDLSLNLNLLSQAPKEATLVYFGGNETRNTCEANNVYNYAHRVMCTHAYAVNVSAIPNILKVLNANFGKIDEAFAEYQNENPEKCVITKHCYAWQAAGFSTINGVITTNEHLKY